MIAVATETATACLAESDRAQMKRMGADGPEWPVDRPLMTLTSAITIRMAEDMATHTLDLGEGADATVIMPCLRQDGWTTDQIKNHYSASAYSLAAQLLACNTAKGTSGHAASPLMSLTVRRLARLVADHAGEIAAGLLIVIGGSKAVALATLIGA